MEIRPSKIYLKGKQRGASLASLSVAFGYFVP